VPAGTRELNLKAFRRGWEAGLEAIARLAATRS
jgi:hypothetical protein